MLFVHLNEQIDLDFNPDSVPGSHPGPQGLEFCLCVKEEVGLHDDHKLSCDFITLIITI